MLLKKASDENVRERKLESHVVSVVTACFPPNHQLFLHGRVEIDWTMLDKLVIVLTEFSFYPTSNLHFWHHSQYARQK